MRPLLCFRQTVMTLWSFFAEFTLFYDPPHPLKTTLVGASVMSRVKDSAAGRLAHVTAAWETAGTWSFGW